MKKIIAFLLVIALVKNVDGQECNSPDGGIWLYINGTEKGWTDDAVNHLSVYDTTLCHGDVGILSVVYGGCGPGTTTWSNGIVGDTLTVTSSYICSICCLWIGRYQRYLPYNISTIKCPYRKCRLKSNIDCLWH